jgi:hypothetical protein
MIVSKVRKRTFKKRQKTLYFPQKKQKQRKIQADSKYSLIQSIIQIFHDI